MQHSVPALHLESNARRRDSPAGAFPRPASQYGPRSCPASTRRPGRVPSPPASTRAPRQGQERSRTPPPAATMHYYQPASTSAPPAVTGSVPGVPTAAAEGRASPSRKVEPSGGPSRPDTAAPQDPAGAGAGDSDSDSDSDRTAAGAAAMAPAAAASRWRCRGARRG
ncbi:hypothetical protein C8Q74DRAFT_816741 [Fomes fomentarius]|nr:hypothetical protein C8Q74DRAFT_816741 [Fomes fomentarius]